MAISRELLEKVLEKSGTDKEKSRAQMLYRVFEYYEASVLSYPKNYEKIDDEATALYYLKDDGAVNAALTMAQKRYEILDRELAQSPRLIGSSPYDRPAYIWDGLNSSLFFALNDYMSEKEPDGGPVVERVSELANSPTSSRLRDFTRLLLRAWKNNYINSDPSFEAGQPGEKLEKGEIWEPNIILGGDSNSIKYDNTVSRTGDVSVRLDNIGEAGPAQKVPVKPGLTTVSVHYYSPPGNNTRGSMVIICDLYDKDKNLLRAILPIQVEKCSEMLEGHGRVQSWYLIYQGMLMAYL